MDAAQASEAGLLLRRALDLRAALKLGIRIKLDEVRANEFAAMVVLEEEQAEIERERCQVGRST